MKIRKSQIRNFEISDWTVLLIALVMTVAGAGLMAQSSQDAAVGARLMRGAVDLHYHVDPGYGTYENLVQAKAAGVRALLLKNHYEPTAAIVMLLRPQFSGLVRRFRVQPFQRWCQRPGDRIHGVDPRRAEAR